MYQIHYLNKISPKGTALWKQDYRLTEQMADADAILVLENGVIIERGTHDQLLDMKGRYYELYTGKKELD